MVTLPSILASLRICRHEELTPNFQPDACHRLDTHFADRMRCKLCEPTTGGFESEVVNHFKWLTDHLVNINKSRPLLCG
jgi:hypothetical protein